MLSSRVFTPEQEKPKLEGYFLPAMILQLVQAAAARQALLLAECLLLWHYSKTQV